MSSLKFTGERLMPGALDKTAMEHLHRYAICLEMVKNKNVLDIASGEGYGSFLLAKEASQVIGVDLAQEAIDHARASYPKENLQFIQGSILEIPSPDHSFDVVVSFETLEHVSDHEQTFAEIKRVLKPDGILIISTPEKSVYSDEVNYSNPFHEKELYEWEFRDLIHRYFENAKVIQQKYVKGSLMVDKDFSSTSFRFFTGDFQGFDLRAGFHPEYLVAICSNQPIATLDMDSLFTNPINEKIMVEEIVAAKIKRLKSGFRYRLIDSIFKPWDLIKSLKNKIS
ncbi:class I SAM-dependent methyltransferase [Algoriphagus sanaruensis]|uniref:Methyltransferase type 11 domain-containing protein n=1 Tax=Algoriphagus sanaruensis TaxID=1727163 RepID=A0A142EQT2_9BACT|nr:class I SAM-dependent methyltransferase [Algoriphagus sanaruensis]AMQ57487.1 hypothetical protein AO498_13645 [Algoriphagus sanaruensis]